MIRALWLTVALAAACGPGARGIPVSRPIGEDPIALLPSGADLVLDIDVEQVREWPETRRLLALLPEATRNQYGAVMEELNGAWVAVSSVGTPPLHAVVLARGRLEPEKLRTLLGGEWKEAEYHGNTLWERGEDSLGRPLRDWLVLGSPSDVRRVIDLAHGEGESVRTLDKKLSAALGRAPTAKFGRPALLGAIVPPDPFRVQLRKEDLPGADVEWLALSLALADGFDIGVVSGSRGAKEAIDLAAAARLKVIQFANKATVRAMGLSPFLEPIIIKARDAEVHVAWRVSQRLTTRMVERFETLASAGGAKPAAGRKAKGALDE